MRMQDLCEEHSMNKLFAISLSFCLLLAACQQASSPAALTPTRMSVGETATPISILTATPTELSLPTPSPSPIGNSPFEQRCPTSMGEVSMESIASGTIFRYNLKTEITVLHDLQSGQEYSLPLERKTQSFSGDLSPDRRYYAYTEPDQARTRTIIWVIDAKADVLVKQAVDIYLFNLRWLDNEHLLFDTQDTDKQARVMIFDLKTHKFKTIIHALPGIFTFRDFGLSWRVSYSPDLQKVLYIGDPQENGYVRPVYRDLVSGKTLWEAPRMESIGEVLWSPDGQQVALMVSWDLYILGADGHVVDILKKSQFGYINEWGYSWSPNGRYIGFRASKELSQEPTATLIVYDLKSHTAVDYCLLDYGYSRPGWSPDSTQIVVSTPAGSGSTLLDLQTNHSFKLLDIPDVSYPGEWLQSILEH